MLIIISLIFKQLRGILKIRGGTFTCPYLGWSCLRLSACALGLGQRRENSGFYKSLNFLRKYFLTPPRWAYWIGLFGQGHVVTQRSSRHSFTSLIHLLFLLPLPRLILPLLLLIFVPLSFHLLFPNELSNPSAWWNLISCDRKEQSGHVWFGISGGALSRQRYQPTVVSGCWGLRAGFGLNWYIERRRWRSLVQPAKLLPGMFSMPPAVVESANK